MATQQMIHDGRTSRLAPLMAPQMYKTYTMRRPLGPKYWRPASCEEVGCDHYRSGWVTTVDMTTELGQRRYHYLTHDKTRRSTMQKVSDQLVKFVFAPGQTCFRAETHRLPVGRPPRFLVAQGDWRARGSVREHRNAQEWVEDFSAHQDRLAQAIREG